VSLPEPHGAGEDRERRRPRELLEVPSREAIEALPPFDGIDPGRIIVAASGADVDAAHALLAAQTHVGFDTESKPTFLRGERSEGPHVLQFATLNQAYIFQLHVPQARDAVAALLESTRLTKVGFGLEGDKTQIRARLEVEPRAVLDLDTVFRERGYRKSVGLKAAVAIVFNQRFSKSKRIGTSNWSHRELTERQLLYAANDAFAAMQVFAALQAEAARSGSIGVR
jgi:ribonuclease D